MGFQLFTKNRQSEVCEEWCYTVVYHTYSSKSNSVLYLPYGAYLEAQNTVRAYGINQLFRFVKGVWLHRKSRRIQFFFGKDLFYLIRAQNFLSYHLIWVPWHTLVPLAISNLSGKIMQCVSKIDGNINNRG